MNLKIIYSSYAYSMIISYNFLAFMGGGTVARVQVRGQPANIWQHYSSCLPCRLGQTDSVIRLGWSFETGSLQPYWRGITLALNSQRSSTQAEAVGLKVCPATLFRKCLYPLKPLLQAFIYIDSHYLFIYLRQDLTMQSRLTSNSKIPCPCLTNAEIKGVYHYIQLYLYYLVSYILRWALETNELCIELQFILIFLSDTHHLPSLPTPVLRIRLGIMC